MKTNLYTALISILLITQTTLLKGFINEGVVTPNKSSYEKQLKAERSKVLFEENKGQVKDQHWQPRPDVLYYGQSEGMNFFIRGNGISYQLSRVDSWKEEESPMYHQSIEKENSKEPDQITTYRVDVNWVNAQTPKIHVQGEQSGYNNYYNVPEGIEPALYVKQYEKLLIKNLWPGVDMEYYSRDGHLESDWIVQRAEDYKQIAFEIKGAELSIKNGNLVMKTPLGEIEEGALKVEQNGRTLSSHWVLKGNVVQLALNNYDPNQPLRIDPPVRIWGTYYGGNGDDRGYSCAVDATGNVYLAGATSSSSEIATSGAHLQTYPFTGRKAFLVKFNSSGVRLWGTYYGGNSQDEGYSCALDSNGHVYLAGKTGSGSGIASGGHQNTYGGGVYDAFLVKFNSAGVRQWGTYYGGNISDSGYNCFVDNNDNVYLAGTTLSNDNIATVGSHQDTLGGDDLNAFLVKFNSAGVRQWGTYYGGPQSVYGYSCSVDGGGNVYLSGYTHQPNILFSTTIATPGAHQTTHGGGNTDAFLVKFNSAGVRQWGTFYGGVNDDIGYSCSVDGIGNVYLAGYTKSPNAISSIGAHQETFIGDFNNTPNSFLVKFNNNGIRQWGTYFGYSSISYGCAVDSSGNVYLAGYTNSGYDIPTSGAHQALLTGDFDAFLAKFNGGGTRQWGTFYGGSLSDLGRSCVIDLSGNVYLVGWTNSSNSLNNYIATPGAHQTTGALGPGGAPGAFLVKFNGGGLSSVISNFTQTENFFIVYPNPNMGQFTIQSKKGGLFELMDITGKIINTYHVSANNYTINEELPAGVYIIREKETNTINKFIVE